MELSSLATLRHAGAAVISKTMNYSPSEDRLALSDPDTASEQKTKS